VENVMAALELGVTSVEFALSPLLFDAETT
jgi:hypothetical protein